MESYQNKRKKKKTRKKRKKKAGLKKFAEGVVKPGRKKIVGKDWPLYTIFFLPPEGPGLDCPEQIFRFADFFLFEGWDLKAILKVQFQHQVTEQPKKLHSRVYYYQIGWKICLIGWMRRKGLDYKLAPA